METRSLSDQHSPRGRRRVTSFLIRMVAEPGEGPQRSRLRVEGLELNTSHRESFADPERALTWLAGMLRSAAEQWSGPSDENGPRRQESRDAGRIHDRTEAQTGSEDRRLPPCRGHPRGPTKL